MSLFLDPTYKLFLLQLFCSCHHLSLQRGGGNKYQQNFPPKIFRGQARRGKGEGALAIGKEAGVGLEKGRGEGGDRPGCARVGGVEGRGQGPKMNMSASMHTHAKVPFHLLSSPEDGVEERVKGESEEGDEELDWNWKMKGLAAEGLRRWRCPR